MAEKLYAQSRPENWGDWFLIIRDDRTLSANQKLILFVIASRYPHAFPSYQTISDDSGLSRSTVIRVVKELGELGWLTIDPRTTKAGDRDSNSYLLSMPNGTRQVRKSSDGSKSKHNGVVAQGHHGSSTVTPQVVSERHPKKQVKETREETTPASAIATAGTQPRGSRNSSEQSERGFREEAASASILALEEIPNRGSVTVTPPRPDKKLYKIPGIPGLIPDRYRAMVHPKGGMYELETDQNIINSWLRGELELERN